MMALERIRTQRPLDLLSRGLDMLRGRGINVLVVGGGPEAEREWSDPKPQLVLLDLASLTPGAARELARRCQSMRVPAIALVPEGQVSDVDLGLGFTDFVVCPPPPDELVARARLALRGRRSEHQAAIRVGGLTIDTSSYEVLLKGAPVNLTLKEYELLRLLAANPRRVYTREMLLDQVWGYNYLGGTRTVDVHIRRLRSKLADAENSYIETIWNVGYRFRDPGRAE